MTVRRLGEADFDAILSVVNDGAEAYRGVIPADCWKDPYMPAEELREEMKAGVEFRGLEKDRELVGVAGRQDLDEVTLIRHAYVRTAWQRRGVGGALLAALLEDAELPVLVGTWASASWTVAFYEKHGFRLVSTGEKERLLRAYWSIPARQIETSVVLELPTAETSLRHA